MKFILRLESVILGALGAPDADGGTQEIEIDYLKLAQSSTSLELVPLQTLVMMCFTLTEIP